MAAVRLGTASSSGRCLISLRFSELVAKRIDQHDEPRPEDPDTQEEGGLIQSRVITASPRPSSARESDRNGGQGAEDAQENQARPGVRADHFDLVETVGGEARNTACDPREQRNSSDDLRPRAEHSETDSAAHLALRSRRPTPTVTIFTSATI